MNRITARFTVNELELLSSLASDQLFRREFIDSRLPGCQLNREDLSRGKQLLARLQSLADRARRMSPRKNDVVATNRPRTGIHNVL